MRQFVRTCVDCNDFGMFIHQYGRKLEDSFFTNLFSIVLPVPLAFTTLSEHNGNIVPCKHVHTSYYHVYDQSLDIDISKYNTVKESPHPRGVYIPTYINDSYRNNYLIKSSNYIWIFTAIIESKTPITIFLEVRRSPHKGFIGTGEMHFPMVN